MIDYLERLFEARSIDEVWELHLERMAGFGFDRLLYGLTYETGDDNHVAPEDMTILSNLPRTYLDRYIGDELFLHARMSRWAADNTGAMSWGKAKTLHNDQCPLEREVLSLNKSYRIDVGYTISFGATPPCGRAAIALIAREGLDQEAVDIVWGMHGRLIETMNRAAHLKISALPRTDIGRKLTPRQREVLQLVGGGSTVQEIALAMGLSPVTVEKHLRLAREQLGVETSAQALLKAAVQNHIFLPGK